MFLYKYNQYTMKYYKYDMDEYDIMTPMFDETIHIENDHGMLWGSDDKNTCTFCGTQFDSRNQLFYHLGYMNIDIRKHTNNYNEDEYDDEKGDFGMEPHKKKKRKNHTKRKTKQRELKASINPMKRYSTGHKITDLSVYFNDMKL